MPPVTMLIKPVSGLCNMRCTYCFYSGSAAGREIKSYGTMNMETLETLTRKAIDYADGVCSFMFQGGEPTLAGLDFYKKLIAFQKKYNRKNVRILNAIQTNGYEMSEGFAEFLSEHHFLVGLSLDGTEEIHERMRIGQNGGKTYGKAVKTAKMLQQYNVEFNILCVVNDLIAEEPEKVYAALKKYRFLQFIPCIDPLGGEKVSLTPEKYADFLKRTFDRYYKDFIHGRAVSVRNFDNYIDMLIGNPPESCAMNGVCSCYFLIEGDGSVFPCDFYVSENWKLGNVNKDSFARIVKSAAAQNFIDCSAYISPPCLECGWYPLCRGGCRRDREPFLDGKPQLNKYCAAYKEFFAYAYDRMVKMAEVLKSVGSLR